MLSTVRLHIGRKLPDSLFFRIFGIILLYDKNKCKEIISMYHPDYIKKRKAPETSDDPRVQVHALRQMLAAEQKHSQAQEKLIRTQDEKIRLLEEMIEHLTEENAFLTDCVEKIRDLEAQLDSFTKDQQPHTT